MSDHNETRDNMSRPYRPEVVPRSGRGKRIIPCRLQEGRAHGGHRYIRGDETVVCPGLSRRDANG